VSSEPETVEVFDSQGERQAIETGRRFLNEYAVNEKVNLLIDAALELAASCEDTVESEWGLEQPLEEAEAVRAAAADLRPEAAVRGEGRIDRGDRILLGAKEFVAGTPRPDPASSGVIVPLTPVAD